MGRGLGRIFEEGNWFAEGSVSGWFVTDLEEILGAKARTDKER